MRRTSLLVLPAYLVLTVALTWPLARAFQHAVPADSGAGDALMQSFILGWDWKTLATRPGAVFDAPNFYPERRTLTYMDHLLGEAVLGWPAWKLTGSIPIAYNRVLILSFIATAWAVYRLLRSVGVSRAGSFLGGFLYTFSSYRLSNLSNLNQLNTQFVPLGLLFGLKFLARRRTRDLALAAGTLAAQSYFGWYYTYHLAVVFILLLGYGWIAAAPRRGLPWGRVLAASLAAAVLILPGALPYIAQHRALAGYTRTLGKTALYSADLLDYVKTHFEARIAAWTPWRTGGQPYWLGLVTVALGWVGLRSVLARGRTGSAGAAVGAPSGPARTWFRRLASFLESLGVDGFFLVLGLAAFVLSLGPVLHVAGRRLLIPLPYAALYFIVPGFASMRAPGRFAELALLAAVVLAGRGCDSFLARATPGRRGPRRLLVASLLVVAAAETCSVPIALVELPDRRSLPPVYAWLARQPGDFAILELPMPASEALEADRDAIRQFYSLIHGKPRADGLSGFSPPRHERFRRLMQEFPGEAAVQAAADLGVRYLIVRLGEMGPAEAERVERGARGVPGLTPVAGFGRDLVFALPPPAR